MKKLYTLLSAASFILCILLLILYRSFLFCVQIAMYWIKKAQTNIMKLIRRSELKKAEYICKIIE